MSAAVGVTEHGNSAVLVTVAKGGTLLDRRRIDLTQGLPTHPYHHEGSWAVGRYINSPWAKPTTLAEAISLIERVQVAAVQGAQVALDKLIAEVAIPITGIALRICPDLPQTIEACIRDAHAATMADTIMYRQALAHAAEARGWRIDWYDRDRVFSQAEAVSGLNIQALLSAMGKSAGPPWQAADKLAAAAAILAVHRV